MPYARNSELPEGVRGALPAEAQTVFRTVFNENEDKGEEAAFRIAWTAVKNGWQQDDDGKWVRKADGGAATPAPPSAQRTGSERNPSGSASTSTGGIEISAETETALRNKVKDHNEEHGDKEGKKVTLGQLKAVYRRGSGAYSTSHRPGMTRNQWAMARVNAFLTLVRTGSPSNAKYVSDNDLLPAGHPKRTKKVDKAAEPTNFPGADDNQKITLSNSKFPQFPYSYASNIKENHPEVWEKGGNEFGNQAFVLWGKARGGDDSEAIQNWIKRRERFMNRHQNDFQLAGVVAVMKWGGIVNKGLSHMKSTMNEAKEKTEKADTWKRAVEISKTDDEQQLVFGWLSVAVDKDGKPVLDLQGDIIAADELEKAAYDYVLFARGVGEMHNRTEGVGRLVESMVFTKQKQEALGIPAGTLPETAWWIGYKIDDAEVWKKVKSGEYRAFSIGGRAKRRPVEGDET